MFFVEQPSHFDEPPNAKIMSAMASLIFESHLHCTKDNLSGLFYSCDVREREISGAKRRNYERFGRGGGKRRSVLVVGEGGDVV